MAEKTTPKKVWMPKGTDRKMLAKRFGVSMNWISKALLGQSDSETSRRIRAVAVREYNGVPIND